MDGFAAELVVGVEEGFGEELADVTSAQPVQDPATIAVGVHQAGETEFGQVLAGDGGAASRGPGEGRDVRFGVTQGPQHPDPGGVGQQREGHHRGGHLGVAGSVGVLSLGTKRFTYGYGRAEDLAGCSWWP